ILLKIAGFALQKFPRFNASIDAQNEELVYKHYYNVGIAADTPKGLLVPVVRDVTKKSLIDLSVELTELAQKARDKKISPEEMQGGNFTISNLGGIGGTAFTPIVLPPQVAILGVARSQYKPVYVNDELEKRLIIPLSLSYDHRVIDGADGARFLRWICDVIENPYAILQ
ncbi:MAG: 2-oxo acid dehydrogenase subunit E2, partial [Bacteroidales bacterium]|nr:2-oxo acid dehydrogenase subunit E2 [Bacteroidales bacterium]